MRILGCLVTYHIHTGTGLTFCVGDLEGAFVGGDVGGIGLLVGAWDGDLEGDAVVGELDGVRVNGAFVGCKEIGKDV